MPNYIRDLFTGERSGQECLEQLISGYETLSWRQTLLRNQPGTVRRVMDITGFNIQNDVSITVLQPHGDLDSSMYSDLMAKVKEVHGAGAQNILLDLSDTPHINHSGIVAMHNIAAILRGDELIKPDSGLDTIYAVNQDHCRGCQKHFKLLNPQFDVEKMLERVGYKGFLEIYTDLKTAIASFDLR